MDVLAGWIGQVYGRRPESLFAWEGSDRQARRLLMYGACRYCRGGESLTSLARRFGVSLSGLTMARDRVEQALGRDEAMRQAWRQVEQRCSASHGL